MKNLESDKHIGMICKRFREEVLHMTQKECAEEIGYSKENISSFETGRNANNNRIFLYYVSKGLLNYTTIEELVGYYGND